MSIYDHLARVGVQSREVDHKGKLSSTEMKLERSEEAASGQDLWIRFFQKCCWLHAMRKLKLITHSDSKNHKLMYHFISQIT